MVVAFTREHFYGGRYGAPLALTGYTRSKTKSYTHRDACTISSLYSTTSSGLATWLQMDRLRVVGISSSVPSIPCVSITNDIALVPTTIG